MSLVQLRDSYLNQIRRQSCRGTDKAKDELQIALRAYPSWRHSDDFMQAMFAEIEAKQSWGSKQLEKLFDSMMKKFS